jgi:hypothetical protein
MGRAFLGFGKSISSGTKRAAHRQGSGLPRPRGRNRPEGGILAMGTVARSGTVWEREARGERGQGIWCAAPTSLVPGKCGAMRRWGRNGRRGLSWPVHTHGPRQRTRQGGSRGATRRRFRPHACGAGSPRRTAGRRLRPPLMNPPCRSPRSPTVPEGGAPVYGHQGKGADRTAGAMAGGMGVSLTLYTFTLLTL